MTAAQEPRAARVRTPATCANLGPGFDSLGLALGLHDEITARVTAAGVTVRITGEGVAELSTGPDHLVVRAMAATFETLGEPIPGLELDCVNRIPQARGLGSSSAAIVAGVLLARELVPDGTDRMDLAAVLRLAAVLEGHPDNVAPCLLGGFTVAWTQTDGAHAVRLEPATRLAPVVCVPDERSLTASARAALPDLVPHTDAAANAGRAALLVHALTAAPEHLFAATEDRLHQRYRAAGAPRTAALVARLREAGVPAVVAGAGPSVLALLETGGPVGRVAGPVERPPAGWTVLPLAIDRTGAEILGVPGTVEHAEQDAVAAGRAS